MAAAFDLLKTQTNLTNYGWSPPHEPGHKKHPLPQPHSLEQTKLFDDETGGPPRHETESKERTALRLGSNLQFINNFLRTKNHDKYHHLRPLDEIEDDASVLKPKTEYHDFVEQMFSAKRNRNDTEVINREALKELKAQIERDLSHDERGTQEYIRTITPPAEGGGHHQVLREKPSQNKFDDEEKTQMHQVSKIIDNLLHEDNSFYLGDKSITDHLKHSQQTILGNYHPDAPNPYADEPIGLVRIQNNEIYRPKYYDQKTGQLISDIHGGEMGRVFNTRANTLAHGLPRIEQGRENYSFEGGQEKPMVMEGGGSFWTVPQSSNLKNISTGEIMDDATLWGYRGDPKELEWTARGPKDTRENLNEVFVRQPIDSKRLVDLSTWAKHKHGLGDRNLSQNMLSRPTPETGYFADEHLIPRNVRAGLGHDGKPLMTATGENVDERLRRNMEEVLHELNSTSFMSEKFDTRENYEQYVAKRIKTAHHDITHEIFNEMGIEGGKIEDKMKAAFEEISDKQYNDIINENPDYSWMHNALITNIYGSQERFLRDLSGHLTPRIRMHNDIREKAGITMGDSLKDAPMNEHLWPLDEFGNPLSLSQIQDLGGVSGYDALSGRNPMQDTWDYLRNTFETQERHESLGEEGQEKLLQPPTEDEFQSHWFRERMNELDPTQGSYVYPGRRSGEGGQRNFQDFYSWPELQQVTEEYRGLENDDTN